MNSFYSPLNFSYHFADKSAKLLRLGMKNESIHFVLRSTFRNFAAEIEKE